MKKIRTVYIASPYSLGNKEHNVAVSIDVANVMMDNGLFPFAPLLSHYWDMQHKRTYQDWLSWCLEWVTKCDAVFRVYGESLGADTEVALAEKLGIPVFYSIQAILDYNDEERQQAQTEVY